MDRRHRAACVYERLESRRPLAGDVVPIAPYGFSAAAVSASEVGLVWQLGDDSDSAVVIERRRATETAFATLTVLSGGETIYTDTGCWSGETYAYRVKARGAGGDSAWSPEQVATTFTIGAHAYAAAEDVTVTPSSATSVIVAFARPDPSATSTLVERSANGVAYEVVASLPTATRWEDTGLDAGEDYWYRLRTTGWTKTVSDYSQPVRVTLPQRSAAAPVEPGSVSAVAMSALAVSVAWSPRDPLPTAYVIERSMNYDPWHPITWSRIATTVIGATSFVDTDVAPETPYVYRVRAIRDGVESAGGRPADDVMHVVFGDAVGVVTASVGSGSPRTYDIGPGRPLSRLADLDWSRLGPGDTVNIHSKPGGYRELLQVSGRGAAAAWIAVNGVADPVTGALPVIDAADAVLAPQFRNHWEGLHGFGAIVVGARPGFAQGYKPGYIAIRGLEIRNCSVGNTFTDVDGTRRPYGNVGAGIYLERCDHVTITGCTIRDNGEGIFGAGQSSFDRLMTDIVVDSNTIFGNGNVGSDREHNTYVEAVGTTYQFNRYGPLRPGALGAGLKDRSVGTVIRGNWIEGGLHQLQIPEAQNQADLAVALPRYRLTVVQGNTLVAPPGNGASPIWFGGDQGLPEWYRKGMLAIHHNTIVARSNQAQNYKTTAIVAATAAEAIDVRNTIIASLPDTPGEAAADLGLVGADNRASFSRTWVTPGWRPTTVGDYSFTGLIGGADRLLVGTTVDPGFVDAAAGDYRLAAGSPCVDAAGRTPAAVAAYPVAMQFSPPVGSTARTTVGHASDVGSFEFGAASGPPSPVVPPPSPTVSLVGPAAPRARRTSATTALVSWTDRSVNETGFIVERRQPGGGWRPVGSVAANVTTFTDQGLRPRGAVWYRVRAVDATGPMVRRSPPTLAIIARTVSSRG